MDERQFRQLINDGEKRLLDAGIDSPATEVEIILEYLLDVERIDIYLHGHELIDNGLVKKFLDMIKKRTTRYPLQYILGEAYFYGRKFIVNDSVMIPTPETEILCDLAIGYIKNEGIEFAEILDLGVGSGVIAVTMAAELQSSWITATDISQAAIQVARKNAAIYEVENRIRFIRSDLFSAVPPDQKYDLILSNPPYIAEYEYKTLPPEVLADPKLALVSGDDGLNIIRAMIDKAPEYLKGKGRLMFEIGYDQGEKIADITERDERYRTFSIVKDMNDINRVVVLSI